MTAEFMSTPTAADRTYTVPAAMVASIKSALADPELSHHPDAAFVDKLATTGKAVLDDVIRVHNAADAAGARLRGGFDASEWAERVLSSYLASMQEVQDAKLAEYGYEPDRYAYAGVTHPDDEDVVTHVMRIPLDTEGLQDAAVLTASGWLPVDFDFAGEDSTVHGVGLDADMLAFTASALIGDGMDGVMLAYGEPLCFLDEQPLLAAAPAVDQQASPGHVYAIVDATDTSAVMDLILMRKVSGKAAVYRRNGGKWQLEPSLLESFMSATPPPIVELTGPHRDQIITQVDASNANQVVAEGERDGQAAVGPGAMKTPKSAVKDPTRPDQEKNVDLKPDETPPGAPKPPENRDKRTPNDAEEGPNSRPPSAVTAAYAQAVADVHDRYAQQVQDAAAWYYTDEGYKSGFSLVAAIESADAHRDLELLEAREAHIAASMEALTAARAVLAEQENVLIPALVAASGKPKNAPTTNNSPGQRKAENLRRYWVRGKGAVKIKWGSKGDATRCHRKMMKYMTSEQAWGYCNRRHREAVGFYTGDKRNK